MIFFRADGNASIGSGHIMRCLSIADAFRKKQKACVFIIADNTFRSLIEERGYSVIILNSDYRDMYEEIGKMAITIDDYQPEMIIIDSYYVTKAYLLELKRHSRLVYIDDLAAFAYPVDVLVNYNINGPDLEYKQLYDAEDVAFPKLILGLPYVPLREMFNNVPVCKQNEIVQDVLISTGGSDPIHLSLKLVQYIAHNKFPQTFHFLVGPMNEDYCMISSIAEKSKNIFVHYNVKDMKALIFTCDLVVSAAGSTMYEISACGVPMITYVLADNQISGAEAFEKLGMAISCGDLRDKDNATEILMNSVERLAKDFKLRKQISKKMQNLVDGLGADRLAAKLLEFSGNNYEL